MPETALSQYESSSQWEGGHTTTAENGPGHIFFTPHLTYTYCIYWIIHMQNKSVVITPVDRHTLVELDTYQAMHLYSNWCLSVFLPAHKKYIAVCIHKARMLAESQYFCMNCTLARVSVVLMSMIIWTFRTAFLAHSLLVSILMIKKF